MARYAVIPERSVLIAEARSSLHPIHLQTAGFDGFVEVETEGGEPRVLPSARITLPVALLKANNSLVDGELQRRIEARKYPSVTGELREAQPLGNRRFHLRGPLSLHGVEQMLEADAELRVRDDLVELEGATALDMRRFGLEPPKLLFFKVDPQIRLRVLLVAQRLQPPR